MQDRELIRGCINEDMACQRELYEKYCGLMYTICLRYVSRRAEAQDILQDGFIKVFDNISKYSFNGSFEGWIRKIMVNTSLNYLRKNRIKGKQLNFDETYIGGVAPKAISKFGEEDLLKIIQELPDGYKIVFNLYVMEGYNHKEIADILKIKESTSRSQLSKARKWIQDILLKDENLLNIEINA